MLSLATSPVLAQSEVVAIEKGEPAPFSGMLFPVANAERIAAKLENCEFRLELDRQLIDSTVDLKTGSLKAQLALETDAAKSREALLRDALRIEREANVIEWWQQPSVSGAIGAAIGIGVVIGAVLLVGQLRPAIPDV